MNNEQQHAIENLNTAPQTKPILGHCDEDTETKIHTDDSYTALGTVLIEIRDGAERVIAYASCHLRRRKLFDAKKYSLALIWAIT